MKKAEDRFLLRGRIWSNSIFGEHYGKQTLLKIPKLGKRILMMWKWEGRNIEKEQQNVVHSTLYFYYGESSTLQARRVIYVSF